MDGVRVPSDVIERPFSCRDMDRHGRKPTDGPRLIGAEMNGYRQVADDSAFT